MENKENTLDFDLPNDASPIDIIYEILEKQDLMGEPEEWMEEYEGKKESRVSTVRDAAFVMFQKKISEEKLVELLAQHLRTSLEKARSVMQDIMLKLVPYIKLTNEENESAQEMLLEKLKDADNMGKVKNIDIENVEENAKKLKEARETNAHEGTTGHELQNKEQQDRYRESTSL